MKIKPKNIKNLQNWEFNLDGELNLNKIAIKAVEIYFKHTEFRADMDFVRNEICIFDENAQGEDIFNINMIALFKRTIGNYCDIPWDDEKTDLKNVREIRKLLEKLEKRMEKTYEKFESENSKK